MSSLSLINAIHWTSSADTLTRGLLPSFALDFGFLGRESQKNQSAPFPGHYPQQTHGTTIVEANDSQTGRTSDERFKADGIATRLPGRKIGIQTADCLPLLFYSLERPFVMAVHGGWRGLAAGILRAALSHALKSGCKSPNELAIILGPAIGALRYEVGPEVVRAFSNSGLALTEEQLPYAISKGVADRWHLDLATAACLSLCNLGFRPEQIAVFRSCSFEEDHLWYSYRRSGAKPGRIWSWIEIAH